MTIPRLLDQYSNITEFKQVIGCQATGWVARTICNRFGIRLIKLTNYQCKHRGIVFQEGRIDDSHPLTFSSCSRGGLYFTDHQHFTKWLYYGKQYMFWAWSVEIPDDAVVFFESSSKFKASSLIVKERRPIQSMEEWQKASNITKAVASTSTNALLMPDHHRQMNFATNKRLYQHYSTRPELIRLAPLHVQVLLLNTMPAKVLANADPTSDHYNSLAMLAIHRQVSNIEYVKHPTETMLRLVFSQEHTAIFAAAVERYADKDKLIFQLLSEDPRHTVAMYRKGLLNDVSLEKLLKCRPTSLEELIEHDLDNLRLWSIAVKAQPRLTRLIVDRATEGDWVELVKLHPTVLQYVPLIHQTRPVLCATTNAHPTLILTHAGLANRMHIDDLVDLVQRSPRLSDHPHLVDLWADDVVLACARALPHRVFPFKESMNGAIVRELLHINLFYGIQAWQAVDDENIAIIIKDGVLALPHHTRDEWLSQAREVIDTAWLTFVDEIARLASPSVNHSRDHHDRHGHRSHGRVVSEGEAVTHTSPVQQQTRKRRAASEGEESAVRRSTRLRRSIQ